MPYLTISDELDRRIAALAEKAHVPKDEYVIQVLEEFLDDQEDYLIALTRLELIEKGIHKPIPFEVVLKKLGLEKDDLR
jgi:RHH-type rel operon transcriptional repressor/antitoxin RelB